MSYIAIIPSMDIMPMKSFIHRVFLLLILQSFFCSIYSQDMEQRRKWEVQAQEAVARDSLREAIHFYELLQKDYKEAGESDGAGYIAIIDSLAKYHNELCEYRKAVSLGIQSVKFHSKVYGQNHFSYARSMADLAFFYFNMDNYEMAIKMGKKALSVMEETSSKDTSIYAKALEDVMMYHFTIGDYANAIGYGLELLQVIKQERGEKHEDYASVLHDIANCYSRFGYHSQAIDSETKAMEIYKRRGDTYLPYAGALSNLAEFHAQSGDYTTAVELAEKSLACREKIQGKARKSSITTLDQLAKYHTILGAYTKALGYSHKAWDYREERYGKESIEFIPTLNMFAWIYSLEGKYPASVNIAARSVELREKLGSSKDPALARELSKLANYLYLNGDYEQAIAYGTSANNLYHTILGEKHSTYAMTLGNLAKYHSALNHDTLAINLFSQSLSIKSDNILQSFSTQNTYSRGILWSEHKEAYTDQYPYLVYKAKKNHSSDLYDKSALFAKGILLTTERDMNSLLQECDDSLIMERYDSLRYKQLVLQKLQETPIEQRTIDADSLSIAIARMEQELIAMSKDYGDFTRRLRTTWQDVQGALTDEEIAVEFLSFCIYGTDSTMVAALTLRKNDKEPKFIPLFEQRQLQSVSDTIFYHCAELTDLVWKPLQQELQGVKRIYFSPAGALYNIGIEYAPRMEGYEMYRLSTTREIIDMKDRGGLLEIAAIPSSFPEEGGKTTPMAVLFGGMDYNAMPRQSEVSHKQETSRQLELQERDYRPAESKARPLPGTLAEVNSIKKLFDSHQYPAMLYTGASATETALKHISGNVPPTLLVATHGLYYSQPDGIRIQRFQFLEQEENFNATDFEDKALTRSCLLFSGANLKKKDIDSLKIGDDGHLTAREIALLDLRGLDLVVLSACQTGKGDINQGEGVFGLQRGFKKAGAQTLVMSLWNVDDRATHILMTAFFDNLLQGQSKRDAFHNAQQHLRTVENGRYDKPQFWAAFVLLD